MSAPRCLRFAGRALAGGAALAVASYVAYIGVTRRRFGHAKRPAGEEADALLDRFMPEYDVVERHHVRVAAPAGTAFTAMCDLDLMRIAAVRAIIRARETILGCRPDERALPRPLLAQMRALGWGLLAEIPGREIVVGAVTQPWAATVVFRGLPPDQFAAFHEPGHVKIVWTLRADPRGTAACIIRHETRAVAIDAAARARFRWYWSFFSPGVKVIRYAALGHAKADAEQRALEAASSRTDSPADG